MIMELAKYVDDIKIRERFRAQRFLSGLSLDIRERMRNLGHEHIRTYITILVRLNAYGMSKGPLKGWNDVERTPTRYHRVLGVEDIQHLHSHIESLDPVLGDQRWALLRVIATLSVLYILNHKWYTKASAQVIIALSSKMGV